MIIEICGPGCPKCHATMENVQKAVKELGLEQEVEVREVKDILAITNKLMMSRSPKGEFPALRS